MNPIEEQRQIIDVLYQAVILVAPKDFDSVVCRFDYDHGYDDGSSSIGSQLAFSRNGVTEYALLRNDDALDLVPVLHAQMKAHTGGDWNAFTLTIKEDGRVTTKFEYPEQEK